MIINIILFLMISVIPLIGIYAGITCILTRDEVARRPENFIFEFNKRMIKKFEKDQLAGGIIMIVMSVVFWIYLIYSVYIK